MQGEQVRLATGRTGRAPVVRSSTRNGARRVLVLDDNDLVRSTVLRVLRAHGFEAHAAATGADALVLLQEFTFGLMYCDVQLEEESGIDLLPTILSVAPGLPVVMVSGLNEARLAVQALRAGAHDYVTKPLDTGRFLAMTERLLAEPPGRDERAAPPLPLLAHAALVSPNAAVANPIAAVAAAEAVEPVEAVELVESVASAASSSVVAPVPAPVAGTAPHRTVAIHRDPPIPQGAALIVLPPPRHVPWRVRVGLTLRRLGFRRGVPIGDWAA